LRYSDGSPPGGVKDRYGASAIITRENQHTRLWCRKTRAGLRQGSRAMEVEFQHLDLRYERLRSGSRSASGSCSDRWPITGSRCHRGVRARAKRRGDRRYKRVRALRGWRGTRCARRSGPCSESEALIVERSCAAEWRGRAGAGWLLRELVDRFGLGQDELGRRFDKARAG